VFTIIYTKENIILAKGNYSAEECLDKFQFCEKQLNFDTIDALAIYLENEYFYPSDSLFLFESMKQDYAFLDLALQDIRPISLDLFKTKGCIIFWKDNRYRLTFESGNYNLWIRTKNLGERKIILSKDQGYSLEEEGERFVLDLVNDMNEYRSDIYMQAKLDQRHVR
jgi:hypothetical protein